MNKELNP
ncbi:hypothetical protein KSF78_0002587 [Schistosoma japonicum]|nr:hypothetical protein KSF78_0002587 [Schistosoma japonicum]